MVNSATAARRIRAELLATGRSIPEVAEVLRQRLHERPRVAWRWAMGWSQSALVEHYRAVNPTHRLTISRVSEYESWPYGGTQPPLKYLGGLARALGCAVTDIIDDADREHLEEAERHVLPPVTDGGDASVKAEIVKDRSEPRPETFASSPVPHLALSAAGVGGSGVLEAPAGRYFMGTTLPTRAVPAVDDGRIVATLPKPTPGREPLDSRGRALVVAVVESPDGDAPTLYGMDARRARRWVTDPAGENRLPIPRAYQLDDLTLGVMWAAANFDDALLDDDGALERALRTLRVYEDHPSSTVTGASVDDLSSPSQMWLGSQFCADHIQRHSARLTEQPDFWTREQRGEEASAWLLFEHKLNYLRVYAGKGASSPQRTFCIPPNVVTSSPRPERILLLLAIALMESFSITINVVAEPEYAALPGFVTDGSERAIVATWVGTESLWHVDVPDQRPVMREFSDALAYAQAHSVTAGATSADRLRALASYLDLDWSWLTARCAQLGDYGTAGLISPRSRLLSADGVDLACRYVGTLTRPGR
jgi:hypothetical protein